MREKGWKGDDHHAGGNEEGGGQWSRALIGNFRRHDDWTVNPDLAHRIADALDTPYGDLFVPRREVAA